MLITFNVITDCQWTVDQSKQVTYSRRHLMAYLLSWKQTDAPAAVQRISVKET